MDNLKVMEIKGLDKDERKGCRIFTLKATADYSSLRYRGGDTGRRSHPACTVFPGVGKSRSSRNSRILD
jgi:hypothetical protein